MAEISHEWIWEVDPRGYYTYSSPAVKGILGYEPAEVVGKHWLHFIAPEEKEPRRTRAQEVAARKEIFFRSTVRKTHKDGHTVVVASTGGPILDADGNRLGYRGVEEDITERKQAEEALQKVNAELELRVEERTAKFAAVNEQLEHDAIERKQTEQALRESEKRSRAQYKGIPVPTYTWRKVGEDLVLVDYNDAAEAITHGGVVNFLGKTASEMYQDRPQIQEELWRCFTEKISIKREMLYRFESAGESKHLAVTYAPVPPDLILVHTEDITERKRVEESLAAKTKEYIDTVNLTGDIILRLDKDGSVIFLNDAACQSLGKPRKELLGTDAAAFLHPEDLEA
ncbi:MAG: PAS domain S-box protein, partial [Dehalococcoidia bacterium]